MVDAVLIDVGIALLGLVVGYCMGTRRPTPTEETGYRIPDGTKGIISATTTGQMPLPRPTVPDGTKGIVSSSISTKHVHIPPPVPQPPVPHSGQV